MMDWRRTLFVSILFVGLYTAIESADTLPPPVLPTYLWPCYQNQTIYHRENRYPQTLNTLLDLIRKLERSNFGSNMDARTLASSLNRLVRLDGIIPSPTQIPINTQNIIPFAPSGDEYYRYRVTIGNLIPSEQSTINYINQTLNTEELCNLHFILSNSIELVKRQNEQCPSFTASRGRPYTPSRLNFNRFRRDGTSSNEQDVEQLPDTLMESETFSKKSDFTIGESNLLSPAGPSPALSPSRISSFGGKKYVTQQEPSQCPIENGVVLTSSGSVVISSVLAGIAAGLNRQQIKPTNLGVAATDLRPEMSKVNVDNVWASTLTGVVSDTILAINADEISSSVGLKGAWNNTVSPKWYFLQNDQAKQVTEAELFGALDGLRLGLEINKNLQVLTGVKLSQIIDMFYSSVGLMGQDVRACKRASSYRNYIPDDTTFQQQLEIFATVMHKQSLTPMTITNFLPSVNDAVDAVQQTVTTLQDQCETTSSADQTTTPIDFFTNLVIVIDGYWQGTTLRDILSILVQNNVAASAYQSNTTILCGSSANVLFQGYDSAAFFKNLTSADCTGQMDVKSSLYRLEVVFREIYATEQRTGQVRKGSMVALLMPSSSSNAANLDNIWDARNIFRQQLPDVKFLVATNGPTDPFRNLVDDVQNDVFVVTAPNSNNPSSLDAINSLSKAIKKVPVRLGNPYCGSYYSPTSSSTGKLSDNILLGATKFYKVSPNYFSRVSDQASIMFRVVGGPLTVCYSRTNPTPMGSAPNTNTQNGGRQPVQPGDTNYRWNYGTARQTATTGDSICQTSNSPITLTNPCGGYRLIKDCPPLYFSLYADYPASSSIGFNCQSDDCQYPTNIPYEISVDRFSCDSGASGIYNVFTIAFSICGLLLVRFFL